MTAQNGKEGASYVDRGSALVLQLGLVILHQNVGQRFQGLLLVIKVLAPANVQLSSNLVRDTPLDISELQDAMPSPRP